LENWGQEVKAEIYELLHVAGEQPGVDADEEEVEQEEEETPRKKVTL
jgi:hypothetical protein